MNEQEDIGEQLSAYLDGELSDEQARRVEQAIKDDPSLARKLADFKAARELVRSLPPHKAPEDFAATVMDKAERLRLVAPLPGAKARWSMNWASLATAALVLIAVGIGVVVTVSLTLTPSWPERVARQDKARKAAPAVQESANKSAEAKESRLELAKDSESLRGTTEVAREEKEATAKPTEGTGTLAAVQAGRVTGEISAPAAPESAQSGEQVGPKNVPQFSFDQKQEERSVVKVAAIGGSQSVAGAPSSPGPEDQVAMVPALAAAPGPRPDRPPGVITQVGEPLYHPRLRDQNAATGQPAPSEQPRAKAEIDQSGKPMRAVGVPAASAPASQPSSQPASAPSSRPSTEPSDVPVFPLESEQTHTEGAPAAGTQAAGDGNRASN